MAKGIKTTSRRVFQLSELMIVLVGLLSVCYPGHLKHAQVPHRAPVSSTRPHSRSRPGSSRTSADAHVEPEIFGANVELRNGSAPQQSAASPQVTKQAPAAIALLYRSMPQVPVLCGSCVEPVEVSLILAEAPLPRLGRAPPTA